MKIIAATVLAALSTLTSGMRAEAIQPCGGPFRQCAIEVGAYCSRDADGRQRITYWDHPGNTIRFERCVGGIFEASGRPNPYKTGVSTYGNLSVPMTELLYPQYPNR